MSKKDYSIGLDIGTNSVGWAVTDTNHKLIKKRNKNLWGVLTFNSGETAEKRRTYRSTRRRYNKRRERIRLLREIMETDILKQDSSFFIRLNSLSFLDQEDKLDQSLKLGYEINSKYNLFIDPDFNDETYYNKFKTIYHLRDYLANSTQKEDIRLIYLALHHIVKYRGNFLYEGKSFSVDSNIDDMMKSAFEKIAVVENEGGAITTIDTKKVDAIIKQKTMTDKDGKVIFLSNKMKEDQLKKLLGKQPNHDNFIKAILGLTFDLGKLVSNDNYEKFTFSFRNADYDDKLAEKESEISEDDLEIIQQLKSVYDYYLLNSIVEIDESGEVSISKSMIKRYDEVGKDLKLTKELIKKYAPKEYNKLFRANGKSLLEMHLKKPVDSDFSKQIKKLLAKVPEAAGIINKIDSNEYLITQNSHLNGVIPHQLHLMEMEKILDNQSKYYPVLAENRDKIISILTFRIPYYYGPLNPDKDLDNHWIVKNKGMENVRILPWNHEEVVNRDETAENFITKMTNQCTYFIDEPVLPKYSLITAEFEVLNELNKIRIDNEPIRDDLKLEIIENLFKKQKKVTDRSLREYLLKNHHESSANRVITGYQKENAFSTSLTPFIDFTRIFGEVNDDNFEMIEDIIKDITIFADRKILRERLKKKYSLTKEQLDSIMKLKYTGWSRLSRKLLYGFRSKRERYAGKNVIEIMRETNFNLMQVISRVEDLKAAIETNNKIDLQGKFKYDEVKDLAGSPAIKKGIWQSLKIVNEIIEIMGHNPTNVFLEFSREEGEKKRTKSRKDQINELYENILNKFELSPDEKKEIKNLQKVLKDQEVITDKLFLYFTQLGKSMYSGKLIDLETLINDNNGNIYDIDHIIPQSLKPGDNIDNRVLVLKTENAAKSDALVINKDVQVKMHPFWQMLLRKGLITSNKFNKLFRDSYSEKEINGFIDRQLVETRQIIKNVTQIINNHYPMTKVIPIRAELTSGFRKRYSIYKSRLINDYHHAHDAYISCVVGNYIMGRFPRENDKFVYGKYIHKEVTKLRNNGTKVREGDGYIISSMRFAYESKDAGYVWNPDNINVIKKCFNYKDCFIVKKLEEIDGQFYNENPVSNNPAQNSNKAEAQFPINKYRTNLKKHGGYTGVSAKKLFIVEGIKNDKKGSKVYKLVGIPTVDIRMKKDFIEQIKIDNKLKEVKILTEVKKNQLIEIDNGKYFVASDKEVNNGIQLIVDQKYVEIAYNLESYMKKPGLFKDDSKAKLEEDLVDLYEYLLDKIDMHYPLFKEKGKALRSKIYEFQSLDLNEKADIVSKILSGMHANAEYKGIKQLKISEFGRLKKVLDIKETIFIYQSVTGFYEKRVKYVVENDSSRK